jgi:hypothetical protein
MNKIPPPWMHYESPPKMYEPITEGKSMLAPRATLKLITVDTLLGAGEHWVVEAQFNPKEIQVDEQTRWAVSKEGTKDESLEYTRGNASSMSFELLFDGFESGRSVQPAIDALKRMLRPMGSSPDRKRPPRIKVVWGARASDESLNLPPFVAVIESVGVKYTMFDDNGKLLRATANVKLKETGLKLTAKPEEETKKKKK